MCVNLVSVVVSSVLFDAFHLSVFLCVSSVFCFLFVGVSMCFWFKGRLRFVYTSDCRNILITF